MNAHVPSPIESGSELNPEDAVYLPLHLSGGIPHCFVHRDEAVKMGAVNIRPSEYEGQPTPWAGLVADWPA